jgi:hypothetical protein
MRKLLAVALLVLAGNFTAFAQTPTVKPAYDFSLSHDEKIKLAESAAPPEVSSKATVYILEHTGYVKVSDGTNGFSCIVDRENPFNSEPMCFDAEGSATTLQMRIFVEDQRANGKSEDEIKSAVEAGYKSGKFKAPTKPGICYMLSDSTTLFVNDKLLHAPPHLMFYAPYVTAADLGSPPAAANMPHIVREGQPDAYIIVFPAAAHSVH